MNRRNFLQSLSVAAGATPFVLAQRSISLLDEPGNDDEMLCKKKFDIAVSQKWTTQPIGTVVVEVGQTFLGTEYVGNVLEAPGDEHLVVNMTGLDCVTFYENSLVIARCVKLKKMTFDEYKKQLQLIRYRGGILNGYTSRLHYTSDYFYDNDKRGIWKNITKELGGSRYVKTLNFMSTHPENYRQIRESAAVLKEITVLETEISKRDNYYVPKDKVEQISCKLQDGDIIGITTNVEGIDTSHTGVIVRQSGIAHLMHAPLAGKKVQISEKPLHDYLAANKRQTGIIVVRPLEPV
jgi:hypothetical protein